MNAELERVCEQLEGARRRAHEIAGALTPERWTARPAPDAWSVGECIVHLNLTSRAYLPLLDDAFARARGVATRADRYRMDLAGFVPWIMTRLRIPVSTTDPFVPKHVPPRDVALAEFDVLHDELVRRLAEADGLDLNRVRIVSPFSARLRYNAYAALKLLAEHQALHVRQLADAARLV